MIPKQKFNVFFLSVLRMKAISFCVRMQIYFIYTVTVLSLIFRIILSPFHLSKWNNGTIYPRYFCNRLIDWGMMRAWFNFHSCWSKLLYYGELSVGHLQIVVPFHCQSFILYMLMHEREICQLKEFTHIIYMCVSFAFGFRMNRTF